MHHVTPSFEFNHLKYIINLPQYLNLVFFSVQRILKPMQVLLHTSHPFLILEAFSVSNYKICPN